MDALLSQGGKWKFVRAAGGTLGLGTAGTFMGDAQSEIYAFAPPMTLPCIVTELQQIKGISEYEGVCFCNEGKRQSNKKIIKVTTCEKLKPFPLSISNL